MKILINFVKDKYVKLKLTFTAEISINFKRFQVEKLLNELAEKTLKGDMRAVARLISLIENDSPLAKDALKIIHKHAGRAHVVGITGPGGVGKSCLVNKLIGEFRSRSKSVGVLAIDPTSPFTGGAILGDRVRMRDHSLDPDVFIRSMGSRGCIGGISRATGNAVKVLDASGKDIIIIETVGSGQVQVDIVKYAQTITIVLMPKMGDEIQAMKTGLFEIGDIFVVNKADIGDADRTVMEIEEVLGVEQKQSGEAKIIDSKWEIPVLRTVALTGEGIPELAEQIEKHKEFLIKTGKVKELVRKRSENEILDAVTIKLENYVTAKIRSMKEFEELIEETAIGNIDPGTAADKIVNILFSSKK